MAHVAIPLAEEFEDSEYTLPRRRLEEAGHQVTVIGVEAGSEVEGKRGEACVQIDSDAKSLDPGRFDALLIPGGHSPDHLRIEQPIVDFVRRFAETGRLIAAVCHGPQLLIEADLVAGRRMTSWPSVKKDLENAGARWEDAEVVEDGNFVTSRNPGDLEAFSAAILRHLSSRRSARDVHTSATTR